MRGDCLAGFWYNLANVIKSQIQLFAISQQAGQASERHSIQEPDNKWCRGTRAI